MLVVVITVITIMSMRTIERPPAPELSLMPGSDLLDTRRSQPYELARESIYEFLRPAMIADL